MNFFYKESKSYKKNILVGGRGGSGGVATVSDFFFQKNPSLEKKNFFEGVKVREDWLV